MRTAVVLGMAVAVGAGVVPTFELEPGVFMPMMGLGTWQYNDSVAGDSVLKALQLGYSHIDTANAYGNQAGIGAALKASGRSRGSYFITTKINGGQDFKAATHDLDQNLELLGLDYVDLVLAHFPATWDGAGGPAMRKEGWMALEAFKKAGKAKSIGVSHYCKSHLDEILSYNTTIVSLNQVEYHIGVPPFGDNATDYKEYCQSTGVKYMAFSTLCGPCGTTELINGPLVVNIGKKYGKSGAQVSLRWAIQQGIPVIPKANSVQYLTENMDLFDWSLSAQDMATLFASRSPPPAGDGTGIESGDCKIV